MSEPIINSLRRHNLHKKPEVLAAANRTRQTRGTSEPDPHDPDAIIKNYIDRFTQIFSRQNTPEDPKAKERGLTALKQVLHKRFIIGSDSSNFDGYFASQAQHAESLGQEYKTPTADEQEQRIQSIITAQQNSLDVWIDYLASDQSNYPPEQKYLALSSILKMGVYDSDTHTFSQRYKKTYKPFPDLNSEALGIALTHIATGEAEDFSNTYGEALHTVSKQAETLAEQREQARGEWRLYPRGSDYHQLMEATANLGTGWCFATNELDAKNYTAKGDQWLYFTPGTDGTLTVPRIGISIRDGKIFEAHGVVKGQAMEGDMAKIAQAKLAEFPGHELYEKRTQHTEQLVAIEQKIKAKQPPLDQKELAFLYEVDGSIATFGRGKDTRIAECLAGRDVNADMLVMFGCTSLDQIAHSQTEVRADTKAYIGPLYPNIFKDLYHLENIYTQFPEKKIHRTKVEIGGKTRQQLQTELEAKNIQTWGSGKEMIQKIAMSTERTSVEIVEFTIADLGFPSGCTRAKLFARAAELGLEFCPAEVGPHHRLQYTDQPDGELLSIGMEPIGDSNGHLCVFYLDCRGGRLQLHALSARSADHWHPIYKVAFRVSPSKSKAGKGNLAAYVLSQQFL